MTQHRLLLPRYKQLRQVALPLNTRLVETLPRNVLDEGGKKLGILKKNTLVLDSEDEIAVLMDYCIYDIRRQGLNAVERFLNETPPPEGSDERVLLEAMRQARFSLVEVEASEPGVGVQVRDVLRDESLFIVDVGFSSTARPRMVLAARIMAPAGITMTTGAALPFSTLSVAERARVLQEVTTILGGADFRDVSAEKASEVTTLIIRTCLQKGAAEKIRYSDLEGTNAPTPLAPASSTSRRVGRNDPCPCGSGKKFKLCCGGRR